MRKLLFPSIVLVMAFTFPERKKITIWLCGDSTMSIKEKRAYPETGWGMPFVYFWDSTVVVENLAKNGIMGFSAGGHLAATAATHFTFRADKANNDTASVRPDFAILIYPVISFDTSFAHIGSRNKLIGTSPAADKIAFFSNELHVSAGTPPTFLVHAGDDKTVPVENSIRFYQACIKNKVPVEMHLYPKGGHGFGLNNTTTTDNWMERLKNWLMIL